MRGFGIIVLSGILNATFPLPMKYIRSWKWENTWLAFCTLSLLVLPLGVAFWEVPGLASLYRAAPAVEFLPAVLGGLLWGAGQVSFGIAIPMVGMAMAFAIVVGMCSVLGSFFPMLIQRPEALLARPGLLLLISAVILAAGLVVYARAARQRERDGGILLERGNFRKGLALCLFTGTAGAAINLGFALSSGLAARAAAQGASPQAAGFAVWGVLLPCGYVPNLLYCLYLLTKNRTVSLYAGPSGKQALLIVMMALLWLSGWLGYGVGATSMGAYGTSIGFAVYMTTLLLWSTYLGVMTGEWRQAKHATVTRMRSGVAAILVSVVILSFVL